MLVRHVVRTTTALIVFVAGWVGVAAVASAAPVTPNVQAAPPQLTCTETWVGPAGGDWAADANWTPAGVPTGTDVACVAGGSPVVATPAQAGALVATQGAQLEVDNTLNLSTVDDPGHEPVSAVITNSDITGTGTVTSSGTTSFLVSLTGVTLDGVQFAVGPLGEVDVAGSRQLCGGRTALCLADGAGLSTQSYVYFTGPGDIRHVGTGTSLSSTASLIIQTTSPSTTLLVDVPLNVSGVGAGSNSGGGPAKATLTSLSGLESDGTLEAGLELEVEGTTTLVIPRSIVTADAEVLRVGSGHIVTPDGADALATLTTVGDVEMFLNSETITPVTGTLTNHGQLYVYNSTVNGNINNVGTNTPQGQARLQVNDTLVVTGTVTVNENSFVLVYQNLTAPAVAAAAGSLQIYPGASLDLGPHGDGQLAISGIGAVTLYDTASINGNVAQSGGTFELSVFGPHIPCITAHVAGSYRSTGAAEWGFLVTPSLSCGPELMVSGSASLPRVVSLYVGRPRLPLGTQRVLVEAQGGLSGTIRTVVTDSPFGAQTWEPTSTSRRVIVTKTSNS